MDERNSHDAAYLKLWPGEWTDEFVSDSENGKTRTYFSIDEPC